MRLAAFIFAAFPVVADMPQGEWDFLCAADQPVCYVKKSALSDLIHGQRPPQPCRTVS